MRERYVIAFDLGTTGNKASIFNENGEMVSSTFSGYQTYYPANNYVEQDPLNRRIKTIQVHTRL